MQLAMQDKARPKEPQFIPERKSQMSQNTTEEIKAIARRYVDVWNQHDPAALDTVFAANAVRHDPATGVDLGSR